MVEAESLYRHETPYLSGYDEGYSSWGSEQECCSKTGGWREGSSESEELNFAWVSQAVGCGAVLPRDLSDALSQVGLRHVEVPKYMGSCLGKRGRDSMEEDDANFYPVGSRKKGRLMSGRWTPGSSNLFQGLLAQSEEEESHVPMFRL